MVKIKNKSVRKSDAAQCLINNGFYTESVHCIYYSTFLYMKHILHHISAEKGRVTYSNQEIRGASSHLYILKLIKERITTEKERLQVEDDFKYLKNKRKKADYTAELLSAEECYDIKEKAELLKRTLNKIFRNI